MSDPLLSVVVPIYNVEAYLRPCLDSILASTLTDLEIICVDDGSTDASGAIAHEYAQRDARISVVTVENGGLGRARNIGLDRARGKYLAFVDSDDQVTTHAYERMCESLESTGSDIAAGRVRRLGLTRTWASAIHSKAIPRAVSQTHISRHPELVYDTTAWNKVFRRSFWDAHHLRFPEGVVYEDMPVTIPAHVLASSVDLLLDVVYEWRERGDGSLSITQRRAEVSNLRDRLEALEHISDVLIEHDLADARREHDRKVLTLDMSLYLGVLDVADDEFRELFADHMRRYLEHVEEQTLNKLPPWERVAYALLQRGGVRQTVELVRERKAAREGYDVRRRGTRLYADLPFFDDSNQPVVLPRSTYDVTYRLPIRCSVEDVAVDDDHLVVRGYALISGVPFNHAWSAPRYISLSSKRLKHRVVRPMVPVRNRGLAEKFLRSGASYDMAGYRTRIPLNQFRAPASGVATYYARVGFVNGPRRRSAALARPRNSWQLTGVDVIRSDGALVSAHTNLRGQLTVSVTRDYALAERMEIDPTGTRLTLRLRLPDGHDIIDPIVKWSSDSHLEPAVATLAKDPEDARRMIAVCDLSAQRVRNSFAARRVWRATVEPAAGDGQPLPVVTDRAGPLMHDEDVQTGREITARAGAHGLVVLSDRRARVRVTSAHWTGGRLHVGLVLPAALYETGPPQVALTTAGGDRVEPVEMSGSGEQCTVVFDVLDGRTQVSLKPTTWHLRLAETTPGAPDWWGLTVDTVNCQAGSTLFELPRAEVQIGPELFTVVVRSVRVDENGTFHQNRLQTTQYEKYRRRPVGTTVLFQAWAGKQYSDNPRALYEQMQRQDYDLPAVWVRRDTSVRMPDGVRSVVLGTREYFAALAQARYVIANDSMPPYYVKREGSTYLQTWHGTPLKRIGFDIENAQFGNVNYLDQFAVEVTKWDALISPNQFSTQILRRAFRYGGEVLETGYPRNDIFYAPDVEERRAEVRARLRLQPHQRVILWAPTWREDQRDNTGHYSLALPFDPATWENLLGADDVLLFRGHQLLQETVGARLQDVRQVHNVTMYPDIQDLYLAADLLITDYSSVMFDFANTRRPMIFYAWDLDHYRDHLRGFYLDFAKTVPGPVVTNFGDLRIALADPDLVDTHAEVYARFVERFCGLEDGEASARVLKAILGS
ncbi:CDP-glycerol glycerophosphotransferase family protein [uncultured Jatrophihabitans sp.]|uniref:bifunctional glycosyltransferase/CDP-glycerol:glycerophosphate glycerophosphotransferase n=1 Tax=uncultured Jatrophihabitans sp. TaxID=1610747 RepID=UPI0035CA9120